MKLKILQILSILCIYNISLCSVIMDKTFYELNNIFPENIDIKHRLYQIDKETANFIQSSVRQKFFRNEVNYWHIINSDSSEYFAILDNVKGKSLPITFLTVFDENKKVYDSAIIKYRESYGGEVENKSWLNQFINFNKFSDYKSVSSISGATISVNSLTKGINKLSILIDYIIKDFDE